MSYGIRVKNPLTKHVRVQVWEGKKIIRDATVDPGVTKFIALDKAGDYEVRTMIVDNVHAQSYDELGPGAWKAVDHEDVAPPQMKPVSIVNTVDLVQKFWREVVTWKVAPGSFGELLAVEIEQSDYVAWRLKVMKPGDGRFGGKLVQLKQTTSFSGNMVTGGEVIKLQAKSISGERFSVSGRISGRETVVHESLSPAKVETQPVEEEEEVPVRSLADMFKELEEQEVKV